MMAERRKGRSGMENKRMLVTVPKKMKESLLEFSKLHDVGLSLVIQRAITEMSGTHPNPEDVDYVCGETETEQVFVSLSDTGRQLLELWTEQTGMSKSMLIMYSLQNTVMGS